MEDLEVVNVDKLPDEAEARDEPAQRVAEDGKELRQGVRVGRKVGEVNLAVVDGVLLEVEEVLH